MEKENFIICIFCCLSFPCFDKIRKGVIVKRFLKEVLNRNHHHWRKDKDNNNWPNINNGAFSACEECVNLLENASEARRAAREVECRVEELQLKILKELGELQKKMRQFYVGMRRIEDMINISDASCFQQGIIIRSRREEGGGDDDNEEIDELILIREQICEETNGLATFQMQISSKLLRNVRNRMSNESFKIPVKTAKQTYSQRRAAAAAANNNYFSEVVETAQQYQSITPAKISEDIGIKQENIEEEDNEDTQDNSFLPDDDDDDDDNPLLSNSEEEDDDDDDKASTKEDNELNENKSQKMDDDINFSEMSDFRKQIVCRVLKRQNSVKFKGLLNNKQTKKNLPLERIVENELQATSLLKYDKEKGSLSVRNITGLLINDEEKYIACSQCSYRNYEQRAEVRLLGHILGHHLNAFHCRPCKKSFKCWEHYKIHRKGHKQKETCEVCGVTLANKAVLKYHLKKKHFSGGDEEPKHNTTPLKSEEEKKPKAAEYHHHHHHHHHRQKPKQDAQRQCSFCGKTFTGLLGLKKHERTVHVNETFVTICPTCGKTLKPSAAEYHTKYVCGGTDEPRLKCHLCPLGKSSNSKTYKNPLMLKRHIHSSHTAAGMLKKYKCEVCGRGFKLSADMRKHMNIHQRPSRARGRKARNKGKTVKNNAAEEESSVIAEEGDHHRQEEINANVFCN